MPAPALFLRTTGREELGRVSLLFTPSYLPPLWMMVPNLVRSNPSTPPSQTDYVILTGLIPSCETEQNRKHICVP